MTEVKIQTVSNHLANKISIAFFQEQTNSNLSISKLLSVAEDSILSVCSAKTGQLLQKFDLTSEFYALASNSVDKIALGGEESKIDLHSITQNGELPDDFLSEPYLAMKFQGNVHKIQWANGRYVLGFSEDGEAQMFNEETEKVIKFKPGHEGSIKSGALDPLGEYFASTGCDGNLNIYRIPTAEDQEVELVKTMKICKQKTVPFDRNPLEVTWTPDGSKIYVAGDVALGIVDRNEWNLTYSNHFTHKQIITCVTFINDNVLATAGMDKQIKIWDCSAKIMMHYINTLNEVLSIQYCQKNKCMAYVDFESNIGFWQKDFPTNKPHQDSQPSLHQSIQEVTQEQQPEEQQQQEQPVDMNEEDLEEAQAMAAALSQSEKDAPMVLEEKAKSQQSQQEPVIHYGNPKAGKSLMENNAKDEVKVQQVKSKADEIIDTYPQQAFVPNCHYGFSMGKYRILAWNMVGTICLREELQFTSVDVDFTNKQLFRNLVFNDDFGAQMACLNYSGLLLASKAVETDLDNYEEDEDEDMIDENEEKKNKKYAHIYFKPFSTTKNLKDWTHKLEINENVECMASGSGWCAVATDMGYIRIFSAEGIQKQIFCQATPLVSMAGYENILAIVYHSGPSIYGCQALKLKMIEMSNKTYQVINEIDCPITRYSNLTWMGFSEEGQFYTYDNDGVIRALNPQNNQWFPALDFKIQYKHTYAQMWIVGISEGEVLALELPKNYAVPHINQKSFVKRYKLKIPFLAQEKVDIDSKDLTLPQIEEEIFRLSNQIEFEQFRKDNWEHLKHFRTKFDNEYLLSESIMNNQDIVNKKKEVDKLLLNAIRLSIMSEDFEKVFSYMDMFNFSQSLKLCVNLCDKLNQGELAQKIAKFIQDKEQKDIMLESYKQKNNMVGTGKFAERRMFKASAQTIINAQSSDRNDLSSFAINGSQSSNITQQTQSLAPKFSQMITVQDQESNNSNAAPVEDLKPAIQKNQNNTNPFLKKTVTNSVNLAQKNTALNNQHTDIFKDLSDTSKVATQLGTKRLNSPLKVYDAPNIVIEGVDIPKISEPEDKGNVAYYFMLLFGIGALLPWNAILTALDFFSAKLTGYHPEFVFGFAVNSLLTFVQVFIMLYGYKLPYILRISGGFLVIAVLMIVLPLVTQYTGPDTGFAIDICVLLIFGAAGGIVQGSVFGLGGMLPGKYMGAVMFGNGLSGIAINTLRAICLAIFPPKQDSDNAFYGALVYFILAAILLVICAVCFVIFIRLPFTVYYIKKANAEKLKTFRRISSVNEQAHPRHASGHISNNTNLKESLHGNEINKSNVTMNSIDDIGNMHAGSQDHNHLRIPKVDQELPKIDKPAHSPLVAFLIMMKNSLIVAWMFLVTLTMVFVVTFVVFPGVTLATTLDFLTFIKDTNVLGAWNALFFIFLFNIFDTFGRWLGGQPFGQASDRLLYVLTYGRVIFIATFILIAFAVPPAWLFGIQSDWFKIVNMILFATSNGYCSTQCAIKSPSRAPDDSKEQVGTFIGVFLTLGIMLGSIIAIPMGKIKFH